MAIYRATCFNKPATASAPIGWHQDQWRYLDREPQVTLYLAIDPADRTSGCIRVLPGSHAGQVNPPHPPPLLTAMCACRCAVVMQFDSHIL